MQSEIIFSSLDLLTASVNRLAKAHGLKEDGVFTVDLLRSKLAIFLMMQDEKLAVALSKFALESIERDNKIAEELNAEKSDVQGHPI